MLVLITMVIQPLVIEFYLLDTFFEIWRLIIDDASLLHILREEALVVDFLRTLTLMRLGAHVFINDQFLNVGSRLILIRMIDPITHRLTRIKDVFTCLVVIVWICIYFLRLHHPIINGSGISSSQRSLTFVLIWFLELSELEQVHAALIQFLPDFLCCWSQLVPIVAFSLLRWGQSMLIFFNFFNVFYLFGYHNLLFFGNLAVSADPRPDYLWLILGLVFLGSVLSIIHMVKLLSWDYSWDLADWG